MSSPTNQTKHMAQCEQQLAYLKLLHKQQFDPVIPAESHWGKEYSSLDQKIASCNYDFMSVNSPRELVDNLLGLQLGGFYFRGQRSATWKVYSSLQRKFIARQHMATDDEMFRSKVSEVLNEIQRNNLTQKAVGVSASELFDYEILGHLQHYGVATPFIDFAKNPYVALYFATRPNEDEEFNYHSVYAVDGRYREGKNEIVDFEEWLKDYDGISLPKDHLRQRQLRQYKTWNVSAVVFHVDENGWNQTIHERRIEKQTGLFLYMKDLDKPAEEYFAEYHKFLCSNMAQCDSRIMRRMICFDFPASWDNELHAILRENAIDEDSLGLSDHAIEDKWRNALQGDFPDFF